MIGGMEGYTVVRHEYKVNNVLGYCILKLN